MNDAAKLADEIAIEDKSTFSNAEWELIVTGLRSLAYPEGRTTRVSCPQCSWEFDVHSQPQGETG